MPSAADYLEVVAPYLYNPDDARYSDEGERAVALAVAEAWRPTCLPAERQNLAQAYRAAFELSAWARMRQAAGAAQQIQPAGAVVERQEGDVRVKYSEGKVAATTSTGTDTGPGTPYALWREMWLLCAAVPGEAGGGTEGPPRRGGIITRAGFPP